MLIAVVDGLKGFPEAITATFPQATVQTCIVHLVHHSLNFCSSKHRKAQSSGKPSPGRFSDPPHAADLRQIYQAPTADQAAVALDAFEAAWGEKYAAIPPAWRRTWEEVTPFFAFPPLCATIDPPDQSLNAATLKDHPHHECHRKPEPHASGKQCPTLFSDPPHSERRSTPEAHSQPKRRQQTSSTAPSAISRKAAELPGNGLPPATNSMSCSQNASMREHG